jgi:hypothetical protein
MNSEEWQRRVFLRVKPSFSDPFTAEAQRARRKGNGHKDQLETPITHTRVVLVVDQENRKQTRTRLLNGRRMSEDGERTSVFCPLSSVLVLPVRSSAFLGASSQKRSDANLKLEAFNMVRNVQREPECSEGSSVVNRFALVSFILPITSYPLPLTLTHIVPPGDLTAPNCNQKRFILAVIPVNTGQMQGLIAQQTDLIDSFGLDSPQ